MHIYAVTPVASYYRDSSWMSRCTWDKQTLRLQLHAWISPRLHTKSEAWATGCWYFGFITHGSLVSHSPQLNHYVSSHLMDFCKWSQPKNRPVGHFSRDYLRDLISSRMKAFRRPYRQEDSTKCLPYEDRRSRERQRHPILCWDSIVADYGQFIDVSWNLVYYCEVCRIGSGGSSQPKCLKIF